MKDVDARLIKDMGFPETVLIENAGRAVAEEACAFWAALQETDSPFVRQRK